MIRVVGRVIRGAGYLIVAGAVLIGIPWASIRFVGWPLPTSVPDGADLRDWFDNLFAQDRFWALVSIVGWLLWAALVFFIVMEVLARLGAVRVPRIRLAAPLQGLAAGMVGVTVTTLTSPAAHATAPAAAATATVPELGVRVGAASPATRSGPHYLVERGDWLSAIAARFLGDPDAYPRLHALNPELEARDARFPNHIEPGWRLRLPADAQDRGIRRHAAGRQHQPATVPAAPISDNQPTSPPQPDPSTEPVPEQAGTPDPAVDAAGPTRPGDDLDGDGDGHPDVTVDSSTGAMAGAGLLASLLFALLTAERRRQRGLYAAGQLPSRPANGRGERELRAAQQPADVERLDAALRSLGHAHAIGSELPDIVAVRLVGGDVQVLLGEPDRDPPPPWLDEGNQWALPGYVQPPATAHSATVLPLLVTVGSRAGRHLLIDLERLGTLSIGGHPHRARDLLRHIACELACNTWSGQPTVLLAGFGHEADTLTEVGPDRIRVAESAGAAIAAVHAELARRGTSGATIPPTVLLVASPDAATRARLADLHQAITRIGRCGIAVVATVPDNSAIGPATLTVTDVGTLVGDLPGLRLTTDAATVPVDMLEPMAAVFRAAHLAPPPGQVAPADDLPDWDDAIDPTHGALAMFEPTVADTSARTPSATDGATRAAAQRPGPDRLDEDLAAWHTAGGGPPRLGILGPVEVRMPGVLSDSRHRLYTEMLLYLLTRPDHSADRASIENALWYGHPAGDGTVRKVISKLRRWLGPRSDDLEWIPNPIAIDGIYHLNDGVLLDWHLVQRLRNRAAIRGADGVADLRAALELVRGAPMTNLRDHGHYRRPYTWIGDSDVAPGRIMATIADLAHRVAEHHLAVDDPATAAWAIDQAWLADPDRSFDDLWHDRMHAEHQAGNTAALQQLVNEYLTAHEAEVPEDLPTPTYNRIRALIPTA